MRARATLLPPRASRLPSALLAAFVLALAPASARAADDEPFTFRLAPDVTTDCLVSSERVELSVGSAPGSGLKNEFRAETRIHAERAGEGLRISYLPVSVEQLRNGEPVVNPVLQVVSQVKIVHTLDAEGRLEKVEGFEEVAPLVAEKLGIETATRLQNELDAERLERSERADWEARFGSLIGKSAKVGDVWTTPTTLPPLLAGTPFQSQVKTEFVGWEDCGDKRCIRMRVTYGQEATAPYSGTSERVLVPATLEIHSERVERKIAGFGSSVETRAYRCGVAPEAAGT